MIDVENYAQDPKDVLRAEMAPMTREQMQEGAELYYATNNQLLAAHRRAAQLLNDNGITASAELLTQFARWTTKLPKLAHQLVDIYAGVAVEGQDGYKVANYTKAWLTRDLGVRGLRSPRLNRSWTGVEDDRSRTGCKDLAAPGQDSLAYRRGGELGVRERIAY